MTLFRLQLYCESSFVITSLYNPPHCATITPLRVSLLPKLIMALSSKEKIARLRSIECRAENLKGGSALKDREIDTIVLCINAAIRAFETGAPDADELMQRILQDVLRRAVGLKSMPPPGGAGGTGGMGCPGTPDGRGAPGGSN